MSDQPSRAPWSASAAAGLAAFALYLWLAPNVSGDRDSSEFTLVLALDGIAHPTGYPLYTLFGHRFVGALHALGTRWGFAANAWSAVGGALAIALMHALGMALVPPSARASPGARAGLALPAVGLFLLNPAWTGEATLAEVNAWHQAWVMAAALGFVTILRTLERADRDAPAARARFGAAAGWGLLCGAGLAHHLTSALVSAPLTLALLARLRRSPRGRLAAPLAAMFASALLPLTSYALLYAKALHPGPAQWPYLEPGWTAFWRHVTGAQYQGAFGRFAPIEAQRQTLMADVFPFLVPGLALLLAAALRARGAGERRAVAALLAVALLETTFAFLYGVDDPTSYFLPPMALGLVALAPLAAPLAGPGSRRRWARALAAGPGVLALALAVPWTRTALELRGAHEGLDRMLRGMWRSIRVERGLVLWRHDMYQRLEEYRLLDGEKPGLDVLNPWMFGAPVVRRKFAARYGFDPLGDLQLSIEDVRRPGPESPAVRRYFDRVAARINAGSPLPVVEFDPAVPVVRVLRKPAPTRGAR